MTVADYVKNSAWQDAPSTATPLSAARLNNLETQYDRAKEGFSVRVLYRGDYAQGATYNAGEWVRSNGNLYRARTGPFVAGATGPSDADGDPTYWEPVYTLDPTRVADGALTIAQVAGLQAALDARPPYKVLATEATPVPGDTVDGALLVVLEP